MINDLELVFTVVYAGASCGMVLLNLINMRYKQSVK